MSFEGPAGQTSSVDRQPVPFTPEVTVERMTSGCPGHGGSWQSLLRGEVIPEHAAHEAAGPQGSVRGRGCAGLSAGSLAFIKDDSDADYFVSM